MRKAMLFVMVCLLATNVLAYKNHIDLVTWEPVKGDAWGKLSYNQDNFDFKGYRLVIGRQYTLIRYKGGGWVDVDCLGTSTANKNGQVRISGEMLAGAPRVWLVPSSNVTCTGRSFKDWVPEEYLFGTEELV